MGYAGELCGCLTPAVRPILITMLRISHWLVLGYGWVLVARAIMDAVVLLAPRWRRRLLLVENILLALTDPLLAPIQAVCRRFAPPWLDISPLIGVAICLLLDALIVMCAARL